jgi:hypothetical protein
LPVFVGDGQVALDEPPLPALRARRRHCPLPYLQLHRRKPDVLIGALIARSSKTQLNQGET